MWVWDTLSPVCVLHFHSTLDREFINMVNALKCVVTHTHKRGLSYLFWTLKKLVGIWEEDGGKHSSLMEWHENVLRGFRAHNVFGKPQIMGFAQAQGLLHGEAGDHIGKSGGPILNPLTGWPKSHRGRGCRAMMRSGTVQFSAEGWTDWPTGRWRGETKELKSPSNSGCQEPSCLVNTWDQGKESTELS